MERVCADCGRGGSTFVFLSLNRAVCRPCHVKEKKRLARVLKTLRKVPAIDAPCGYNKVAISATVTIQLFTDPKEAQQFCNLAYDTKVFGAVN